MKKSLIFVAVGTLLSFVLVHYFMPTRDLTLDWYYAFAFGWGWGFAYFLDRPDYRLAKKLNLSFIGVAILIAIGLPFFKVVDAIPSIIQFSIVFVGYYLLASFRESKSLRR